MKNCTKCSGKLKENVKFCGECGEKVEEKIDNEAKEENKKGKEVFCINCGTKNEEENIFCSSCGAKTGEVQNAIIKCGNCQYVGPGERARSTWAKILAWICIFFAPLVTIIYFVATFKYRCPKCKSTFLGIKNKEGVFTGQRGGAGRIVLIIVCVLVGIAIIGILSAVVLASLSSARSKAQDASIKASLSGIVPQAILYWDTQSTNGKDGSYLGLCTNDIVSQMKSSITATRIVDIVCNDNIEGYTISAPLNSGGYWCVDSLGIGKNISEQIINQTFCPSGNTIADNNTNNETSMLPSETGIEYCNRTQGEHSTYDLASNSCGCEKGFTVGSSGKCITLSASCNEQWPNTYSSHIDTAGKNICDCKSGYTFNSDQTACITRSQSCENQFSNTYYIGNNTCDCKNGYTWNSDQTACY